MKIIILNDEEVIPQFIQKVKELNHEYIETPYYIQYLWQELPQTTKIKKFEEHLDKIVEWCYNNDIGLAVIKGNPSACCYIADKLLCWTPVESKFTKVKFKGTTYNKWLGLRLFKNYL